MAFDCKNCGLRTAPEAVVSDIANVLALALNLAVEGTESNPVDANTYVISRRRADQLMSLLVIAHDFAKRELEGTR